MNDRWIDEYLLTKDCNNVSKKVRKGRDMNNVLLKSYFSVTKYTPVIPQLCKKAVREPKENPMGGLTDNLIRRHVSY